LTPGGGHRGAPAAEHWFFALWPDPELQWELAVWARDWAAASGARVVAEGSIHLTLAFLGAPSVSADAVYAAAAGCALAPFTLRLGEPGYFSRRNVGWIGPRGSCAALELLAGALRESLARKRIWFDPQPFVPHITLLRAVRQPAHAPRPVERAWAVKCLDLVRSVPGPAGRRYESLRRFGAAVQGAPAPAGGGA
jgi:RNA 2',3'-cyclic 3'-phosphodiesterase